MNIFPYELSITILFSNTTNCIVERKHVVNTDVIDSVYCPSCGENTHAHTHKQPHTQHKHTILDVVKELSSLNFLYALALDASSIFSALRLTTNLTVVSVWYSL